MSLQESQKLLVEQAKSINFETQSELIKKVDGPNGHTFKIYDLEWYKKEHNKFE